MMEQRSGPKFQIFARDSKSLGIDHLRSQANGTSKGSSVDGSKSGAKGGSAGGFASGFGFKFDVANFDINAVSPTSW